MTGGLAALLVTTARNGPGGPSTGSSTDVATATISGPPGPEGIPLEVGTQLAGLGAAPMGQTIDGIQCNGMEQVAYHVHAHLAVYVNGQLRPIPGGVGVDTPVAQQTADGPFYPATSCYYWLHTHAQDGIIHIESPTEATYTLGQFFAIWGQPITPTRVGPANGTLTVFVNGTPYQRDPADIVLGEHEDIQIDVASPTPEPQGWTGRPPGCERQPQA